MIKIDLLKNHQEYIPKIALLWQRVLGTIWMPELSIEYIEKQLIGSWINDLPPLAHIAMIDDIVVGVASLQENCGIRPDLKPWLGSLLVDPKYQNHGIGKMLIQKTKIKARELGFEKLYLFTFDTSLLEYYRKLQI